ncbi:MAG: AAA family ATPase [Candidatus Dadabacteria bacterium]|nr:AAA family ATPase [Candidatus Dadabacteria bacterium]NIV41720.1 AAA family ATPase [Candidatus Dadabacteria bacterium]NIX15184.1 AAA family ATPase [Candidatus Dadabacteria bacterium]
MNESYIAEVKLKRDKVESFKEYPFSLNAVRNLNSIKLHPAVTFLIGENGSGKSTLLEAIAVAWGFNPEGGTINFNFSTRASHSSLYEYLTLSRGVRKPVDGFFLRAESFFNVATAIDNLGVVRGYGGVSLHEQSHGESFLSLVMNRFSGNSLYILDEPEAALSPQRQMALISRIHDLVNDNSQFIIATHSPIIMSYPNSTIYELTEKGAKKTKYTDTDHYLITKDYLNNYENMLEILMEE